MKCLIILGVLITSLCGCADYNNHIKACDGQDVSTAHLVLDYLPVGAVIDNGACVVTGEGAHFDNTDGVNQP